MSRPSRLTIERESINFIRYQTGVLSDGSKWYIYLPKHALAAIKAHQIDIYVGRVSCEDVRNWRDEPWARDAYNAKSPIDKAKSDAAKRGWVTRRGKRRNYKKRAR